VYSQFLCLCHKVRYTTIEIVVQSPPKRTVVVAYSTIVGPGPFLQNVVEWQSPEPRRTAWTCSLPHEVPKRSDSSTKWRKNKVACALVSANKVLAIVITRGLVLIDHSAVHRSTNQVRTHYLNSGIKYKITCGCVNGHITGRCEISAAFNNSRLRS